MWGRELYGRHALENADTNENKLLKTLLILSSFAFLAISGQAYAFDDFNKATMKSAKVHAAASLRQSSQACSERHQMAISWDRRRCNSPIIFVRRRLAQENTQCEIIGYADHCPGSKGACAELFEIISTKQRCALSYFGTNGGGYDPQ